MKIQDVFALVVRLSGYFTVFLATYSMLGMVLGPADLGFRVFLMTLSYAALGVAILRFAPLIGAFSYPKSPPE